VVLATHRHALYLCRRQGGTGPPPPCLLCHLQSHAPISTLDAARTAGSNEALAVILAGGRSRRFGSPKAFTHLGDVQLLERVRSALAATVTRVVAIGDDPRLARVGLEVRPDLQPNLGPLGGLQSALGWAREGGYAGVLLAGCDMPFISPALLQAILRRAAAGDCLAVAPESDTERSIEPLCAWYSVELLPEIEMRLRSGELALFELLSACNTERLSAEVVRAFGDPATLFLNVNTPEDFDRAMRLLQESTA